MGDYMTLVGSEQVSRAGSDMRFAAEQMGHVASNFDGSCDRLIRQLQQHEDAMREFVERMEALATKPKE